MHTEHVGVPVYGISYDNGILVAVGGGGSSKSGVKNWICAYRAEGGRLALLHKKETGSEAPMNVAVRGTRVAVGVNDRCWLLGLDKAGLHLQKTFQTDFGSGDHYQKVAHLGPQAALLTAGSDGAVRLWKNGQRTLEFTETGSLNDAALSADGTLLAAAYDDSLHIYDTRSRKAVGRAPARKDSTVRLVAFSALHIVSVENARDKRSARISFWDPAGLKLRQSRALPVKKGLTALALDPRGRLAAFGCADGSLGVYDCQRMALIFSAPFCHGFAVTSVQITATADTWTLFSGSADSTLRVTQGAVTPAAPWAWLLLLALLALAASYMLLQHPELLRRLTARL